jgi:hypothetical protein
MACLTDVYRESLRWSRGDWDEILIEGDVMSKDCLLRFKRHRRVAAVGSIFRDLESPFPCF